MASKTDGNWRKQNKTISSRLKVILRKQIFTDVAIDVQGKEFKCHSLILAVGSPYFERAFYHTFKNKDCGQLKVSDVSPEAFQCILTYLYTGEVTFGNEAQAFQTYEAADKLEVEDLKSECEIYLSELNIGPRAVWDNLERATRLKMEKMQKRYMNYVQDNTLNCLQEATFLRTSGSVLMAILKSEKLAIREIDLLNRLAAWGRSNYYSKADLGDYLRHIRFRALTTKELCGFTQAHPNLISAADALAIMQHLELPYQNNLPSWCCGHPRRIWPY